MKKSIGKTIFIILLSLVFVFTGSVVFSDSLAEAKTEENEGTLEDTIDDLVTIDDSTQAVDKEETIYAIADADGTANQVIVTEWLKNADNAETLSDYTELSDIENTNGYETYSRTGNDITWDAEGNEIHYSGTTDSELPVTVQVTYYLDGVETAPEDMAGKSGHVTIRFDYTNNTAVTETIDGEKAEISVPFLMASGLILEDDSFSNVTVTNGTVYNDGSRNIVIGCAVPGLAESLGLDDDSNIPDYVEIEADTTDFSLSMTLTVAMNGLFDNLTINADSGLSDLNDSLTELQDAVKQIADGASDLSDGVEELSDGLASISANSSTLTDGAYSVFTALTDTATEQLNTALTAEGYDAVSLTPSNYSAILTTLLNTISDDAYSQATAAAEAQVRTAVTAQVQESVTQQVTETVQEQVTQQVTAQLTQSLISTGYTEEQAEAYLQSDEGQALINTNVQAQMESETVQQTINTYVTQQMASDDVQQTIETYVTQQMASDDIQDQIDNAVSSGLAGSEEYQSVVSLKEQLDSYALFYEGLTAYTSGVDEAYNGSTELVSGADDLADGTEEFYEGIETLVGSFDVNSYEAFFDRLQAVVSAGKAYQSFGGIADDMSGSVKIIWRTESIE